MSETLRTMMKRISDECGHEIAGLSFDKALADITALRASHKRLRKALEALVKPALWHTQNPRCDCIYCEARAAIAEAREVDGR